jgi:hypothetical protein
MLNIFKLILVLAFLNTNLVYANPVPKNKTKVSDIKSLEKANKYFEEEDYAKAALIYESLVKASPKNFEVNYKLGLCYLEIASKAHKSTLYIEKAIQAKGKKNVPLDVYHALAKSHHLNYKFREAIKIYNDILQLISPQNYEMRKQVLRDLEISNNALDLVRMPVNISIMNLGDSINSQYSEHSPGVNADESMLVFTSKRKGTGGKLNNDNQYFEDIYVSYFKDGAWTSPIGIQELNTDKNDASITLSPEGKELYIYKTVSNQKTGRNGDIFVTERSGKDWTPAKTVGVGVNSPYKEGHCSKSADGNTLYFSSMRPGGQGGSDIYVTNKLPNGKWGKPTNLGDIINTEYDEDAPSIHPDGKTLYFSSNGHKTMGKMDIFRTELVNGKWTEPENVGYPINSTNNDVYYTPTADGKRAYFASFRTGSIGRSDIFLVKMPHRKKSEIFVLKGRVMDSNQKAIDGVSIYLTKNGKTNGPFEPNNVTGKYIVVIDAGQEYDIEIVAENYKTYRTHLIVPKKYANNENKNVITLQDIILKNKNEGEYTAKKDIIDYDASKIATKSNKNKLRAVNSGGFNTTTIKSSNKFNTTTVKSTNGFNTTTTKPTTTKPTTVKPINKTKPISENNTNKVSSIKNTKTEPENQIIKKPEPKPLRKESPLNRRNLKEESFRSNRKLDTSLVPDNSNEIQEKLYDLVKNTVLEQVIEEDSLNYYIQVRASRIPVNPNKLGVLRGIKVYRCSDGIYRYIYKKLDNYIEAVDVLADVVSKGYKDAFIRNEITGRITTSYRNYVTRKRPAPIKKYTRPGKYTIQIICLHSPRSLGFFRGLKNKMQVYIDKNGMFRYTYGSYATKAQAIRDMNLVLQNGFWDAFVTKTDKYFGINPISNMSSLEYTIQFMALRDPKPLYYFSNLGVNNIKRYKGKDNLFRYTYGEYRTKTTAKNKLPEVKTKGYSDSFIRKNNWYKK